VKNRKLRADDMYQTVRLECSAFEKPLEKDALFQWLDSIERNIPSARELCNWFYDISGE
jgi:hypothetical protein